MRTVLVTGASTGIGAATAHRLAGAGWHVLAGVRREQDGALLRSGLAAGASGAIEPIILDVTDPAAITALAQRLGDGPLDGLVNNAGVVVAAPMESVPLDDIRRQFEVNVVGQVAVTQAVLPHLRRATGRIVFMGSVGGRVGQPFVGPYCASKHAIEAIADALRMELRPWGIQVVVIEPGSVRTPLWEKSTGAAMGAMERMPARVHELYGPAIARMEIVSRRQERLGVRPDVVAVRVEQALTAERPPVRRLVGRDAAPLVIARRLLGDRRFDTLLLRATGLPRAGGHR